MDVHPSDLIRTAQTAAASAVATLLFVHDEIDPQHATHDLAQAESKLKQALAQVRVARWGISRGMQLISSAELDLLLEHEVGILAA